MTSQKMNEKIDHKNHVAFGSYYHESQIGPKAGIPRLTIPYIIFSVNFLFEMTQIASGWKLLAIW